MIALLVDVGSTWTKGLAVGLPQGRVLARCQHPTTVGGIMQGVEAVVARLQAAAPGPVVFRAATSSAAGGLRVAAIGLVPDLTGIAARQASLGAGARVVYTGSFILEADDIAAMRQARPDIILLSGGTDGGNVQVILENAARLAAARLDAAVVLAGNKTARAPAQAILSGAGYDVRLADNVLPTIDTLRVGPAQAALRALFLERIVVARGIEHLRDFAREGLLPTPRAVLDAAEFLADGPARLGTTVIVDIGGATTDVHSVGGSEAEAGTLLRGLAEPRVKRTVEGDLGLRVSAAAAAEVLGAQRLASAIGTSAAEVLREAEGRVERPDTLRDEDAFDRALAIAAVAEALDRHAGVLEPTARRGTFVQIGKDLRRAAVVIGSGGVFAARADAPALLAAALAQARAGERLVPQDPRLLIDRDYVLFAVGLLAPAHPQAALALAGTSFGCAFD